MKAFLVYPHQLFENSAALKVARALIIEDPLFFKQYNFHKQKLVLHRASMKFYEKYLESNHVDVTYLELLNKTEDLSGYLEQSKITEVNFYELHDNWLQKRLLTALSKSGIRYESLRTPQFITNLVKAKNYFDSKKTYFFTPFYINQRQRLNILVDSEKPQGGKWTFDQENRKKIPKGLIPPKLTALPENPFVKEAKLYINKNFSDNLGELDQFNYPTTFSEARLVFTEFLEEKLTLFGDYEDAINENSQTNFHSVLTPSLNIGLITPREVVERTLEHSVNNQVSLNSLEGFLRQIIGWREYIRIVYETLGTKQRNSNFFNHNKKISSSFYDGTTGIYPLDATVKNLLSSGYSHHIERLMILGNFMLLSRFNPDEVYRWFMEFYIDSYDWVMVPNVYGMSQFADGGLTMTKPYLSSSNYVLKMSNYKKDEWCHIWDALYWQFIGDNLDFFTKNPRTHMMVNQYNKIKPDRKLQLKDIAEQYLK